jgi:periplasmic copper chaperone A
MKKRLLLALAGAALVVVPAAGAHVTVNPNSVAADSFARFAIRVPNERPNAETTAVTVQLPADVSFVSFQPKPGWERTVTMVKLDKPVTNDEGETVTERIDTVTWKGGAIKPGEFDEFGLSAKVPAEQATLSFPATQTYSNGEVVHWIGAEDSDTPAPRVTLTANAEEAAPAVTDTTAASEDEGDDSSRADLALVLGIAGLVAGVAALALVFLRRPRTS